MIDTKKSERLAETLDHNIINLSATEQRKANLQMVDRMFTNEEKSHLVVVKIYNVVLRKKKSQDALITVKKAIKIPIDTKSILLIQILVVMLLEKGKLATVIALKAHLADIRLNAENQHLREMRTRKVQGTTKIDRVNQQRTDIDGLHQSIPIRKIRVTKG